MSRIEKARPILNLIIDNESRGAVAAQGAASPYDVVWSGIRAEDRPRRLTALTVGRVLWWQDLIDARYMSEAAGAYQVMEDTLRGLVRDGAVSETALFDAAGQDAVALALLDRRGWTRCEAGEITPEEFADQLAREWASLPVTRDQKGAKRAVKRGQSFYAGDGLNKAHASPDTVLAAIREALAGDVPADDTEGQIVVWLLQAPKNTRQVLDWLNAMPREVA